MKQTRHLHLVPRLMSGDSASPYAFMVCTGTLLSFTCLYLVAFINRLNLLRRVRIVGAPVVVTPVCRYDFTPKCGTNLF